MRRDIKTIIKKMKNRQLYLWGAAQTGLGLLYALKRYGITPAGFIDRRKTDMFVTAGGLPVYAPAAILAKTTGDGKPFIIDTTTLHGDTIGRLCRNAGFIEEQDFIPYHALIPFDYQVIVSSSCNLRCISCPVGNRSAGMHHGFMSAATYRQILEKILRESPLLTMVQLFNWGEPFLNRDLAQIVALSNDHNVLCSLSSNMNAAGDLEPVLAARPASLRVSLSGNSETYHITHTGGNWKLLMGNLDRLAALRSRLAPDMTVEVAYHIYATTQPNDVAAVAKLCEERAFHFRPHLAALLPLDNVDDFLTGKPLSCAAQKTLTLMQLPIETALERAWAEKNYECSFERTIGIESDGSVKQCGLWVRSNDNTVAESYLDTPLEQLLALREKHHLCSYCKAKALHRFCSVYTGDTSSTLSGVHEQPLEMRGEVC